MVILHGNNEEVIRPATEHALMRYWDGQHLRTFKHAKARRMIASFLSELAVRSKLSGFYRGDGSPINYQRYLSAG
jgi:hypothetical protein